MLMRLFELMHDLVKISQYKMKVHRTTWSTIRQSNLEQSGAVLAINK